MGEELEQFELTQFRGSAAVQPQVLLDGTLVRDAIYQRLPGLQEPKPSRLFLHKPSQSVVVWMCPNTDSAWRLHGVIPASRFHNLDYAQVVNTIRMSATHEVKILAGNGTWRTEAFRFIRLPGEDKQDVVSQLLQPGDVSFCDILERPEHNGRGAKRIVGRMAADTINAITEHAA